MTATTHHFEVVLGTSCMSPCRAVSDLVECAHATHLTSAYGIDLPDIEKDSGVFRWTRQAMEALPGSVADVLRRHYRLGRTVRFFSDPETLAILREAVAQLGENVIGKDAFVSKVKPTPSHARMRAVVAMRELHDDGERKAMRLKNHLIKKYGELPQGRPITVLPPRTFNDGPYLSLFSSSGQRRFRRFIDIRTSAPLRGGKFDAYGFSAGGLVPHF